MFHLQFGRRIRGSNRCGHCDIAGEIAILRSCSKCNPSRVHEAYVEISEELSRSLPNIVAIWTACHRAADILELATVWLPRQP
jgi:hypothetical protein